MIELWKQPENKQRDWINILEEKNDCMSHKHR
jgi:hypothetical protein